LYYYTARGKTFGISCMSVDLKSLSVVVDDKDITRSVRYKVKSAKL